jgi:hypothetical protein
VITKNNKPAMMSINRALAIMDIKLRIDMHSFDSNELHCITLITDVEHDKAYCILIRPDSIS